MTSVIRDTFELRAAGRRLVAGRLLPPRAARGPVLVFLHEGLGSIAQWRDVPAALCTATGLPGLVYERWGFGGSAALDAPRTPRYLHDEALVSLPEVLHGAGVDDYVLVGHSDGGSIALLHASSRPAGLRGIVTEAAHVFVEELTLSGIRAAVQLWQQGDLAARLARYHGDKTAATFAGWADTWLSADFRAWNIEAELRGIRCPVFALQGRDDEYGTPAQIAAIARGVAGRVDTWLVPACAHVPHLQARSVVLRAIAAFVADLHGGADGHAP